MNECHAPTTSPSLSKATCMHTHVSRQLSLCVYLPFVWRVAHYKTICCFDTKLANGFDSTANPCWPQLTRTTHAHTLTYSQAHSHIQPWTLSLSHTHSHKCNHATIVCLLLGQDFHLPSFVCGWHSHSPSSFPPPCTCHTYMYLYLYLYLPRVYFLPLCVCVCAWVWMGTQVQALFVYMAYWVRTSASNCVELTWRLIGVQVGRWRGEQKQLK